MAEKNGGDAPHCGGFALRGIPLHRIRKKSSFCDRHLFLLSTFTAGGEEKGELPWEKNGRAFLPNQSTPCHLKRVLSSRQRKEKNGSSSAYGRGGILRRKKTYAYGLYGWARRKKGGISVGRSAGLFRGREKGRLSPSLHQNGRLMLRKERKEKDH